MCERCASTPSYRAAARVRPKNLLHDSPLPQPPQMDARDAHQQEREIRDAGDQLADLLTFAIHAEPAMPLLEHMKYVVRTGPLGFAHGARIWIDEHVLRKVIVVL